MTRTRFAVIATLVLATIAVATRLQIFGNPIVYTDEEYYLLVGDRMLHGALPYVDFWDRKPAGLFLLYAAMRAAASVTGSDGVLAYQITGTIVALVTALLIVKTASSFSNRAGALAAGAAYLAWLNLGTAGGGQSPLFYNLPVCAAGLITMRACQTARDPSARLHRTSLAAMLLIGIAMQIKYSVVFEGVAFGLVFLARTWSRERPAKFALNAVAMVAVALLPTALVATWYGVTGHWQAFFYANFMSIFERGGYAGSAKLLLHLCIILAIPSPLIAAAFWPARVPDAVAAIARRFILLWLAVSIAAVVVFGTYLQSYLLPILVPAAIGSAALFGRERALIPAAALLTAAAIAGCVMLSVNAHKRGTADEFERIARAIDPSGCLFVYSGEPAFYRATTACIPTRFAFPSHLSRLGEGNAIGVDPLAEVTRIMQTLPQTVIVSEPYNDENIAARRIVLDALANHYRMALHTRLGHNDVALFRLQPG